MATKNTNTDAEEGQVGGDESPPDSGSYADSLDRLKLLSTLPELTKEQTSEIRALLAARLPDTICNEEDLISPLRAKLWSVMLLGLRPEDLNSRHNLVSESLHGRTSEANHAQGLMHFPKEDQRVLAADIKRTRQAYPMFKRDDVLKVVSETLERYCVGHGISYKQGQHELIAPFVMLQDPPLPVPVLGLLFESFMSRYVSRWYVDEIQVLLVSYRVFRVRFSGTGFGTCLVPWGTTQANGWSPETLRGVTELRGRGSFDFQRFGCRRRRNAVWYTAKARIVLGKRWVLDLPFCRWDETLDGGNLK